MGYRLLDVKIKINHLSNGTFFTSVKFLIDTLMDELKLVVRGLYEFGKRDELVLKLFWIFRILMNVMQEMKSTIFHLNSHVEVSSSRLRFVPE